MSLSSLFLSHTHTHTNTNHKPETLFLWFILYNIYPQLL
uniref:Uncharacterized protein n=1 Tax=Brassica campestris TaxID=3711 RepID=A0A3P6A3C3_BRACM|nr:unnamed protein product [Brassica rapa]